MLTLERERSRLKDFGILREPEWSGLDDNFAGYDVLFYEHGPTGVVNRLIEVKSTIVSPLRFYITRQECRKAKNTGGRYIFHTWAMSKEPPVLHTRSVAEVAIRWPRRLAGSGLAPVDSAWTTRRIRYMGYTTDHLGWVRLRDFRTNTEPGRAVRTPLPRAPLSLHSDSARVGGLPPVVSQRG